MQTRHRLSAVARALPVAVLAGAAVMTFIPGVPAAAGDAGGARADTDPDVIAAGRELYEISCSSCHGENGAGTVQAPDLRGVGAAAADFMLRTGRMPDTDPERQGISKRPAFDNEEIESIVAYVASLAPGPPIPDVNNPAGNLQDGASLFLLNCAACHSAAGDGGALSYGRNAPELHSADRTQIAEAMRIGPGPMPIFGPDTLSDHEVNSIVKYVTYLRNPEEPGGLSLGAIGPITEGLVAILVGLGFLVLVVRWIESRA